MKNSVQAYCGSCEGEKYHKKLFSKSGSKSHTTSKEEYAVIQCLGCGTIAFLLTYKPNKKSKSLQFVYPSDAEEEYFMFLDYEYKDELPRQISTLYDEIEEAFESDSPILAGIGLRALVEAVCIDQKILGDNLHLKIHGLHTKGLLSTAELPILDKLRLIGNASAHEIKSLPIDKLELALSIINHVLKSIYILPKINKQLKLSIGSKPRKSNVKGSLT